MYNFGKIDEIKWKHFQLRIYEKISDDSYFKKKKAQKHNFWLITLIHHHSCMFFCPLYKIYWMACTINFSSSVSYTILSYRSKLWSIKHDVEPSRRHRLPHLILIKFVSGIQVHEQFKNILAVYGFWTNS